MQAALANVASLGKPVMLVPQAFGGGENWARGPSRQEERLMTYLGLLSGAKAIQVRFEQQYITTAGQPFHQNVPLSVLNS